MSAAESTEEATTTMKGTSSSAAEEGDEGVLEPMVKLKVSSGNSHTMMPPPKPPAPEKNSTDGGGGSTKKVESGETDDGWPTEEDKYVLNKVPIGKGAFAKVYIGRRKLGKDVSSEEVAIKVMNLEKGTLNLEHLRQEVSTMKLCKHENVLPLYCCFVVSSNLWLVMPFMNLGSCLEIMRQLKASGKSGELEEEWISAILDGAVRGLAYLHESGWIHRDIKSGNILLDSEANVRLADFGVAGIMNTDHRSEEDKYRTTFVGTPCWMAPEVMKQAKGYTEKADMWSLGITALELAKSVAPYAEEKTMRVLLRTLQEEPPSIDTYDKQGIGGRKSNDFTKQFHNFYKRLLIKEPGKRPSAAEILKDRFLSKCKDPREVLKSNLIPKLSKITSKDATDSSSRPSSARHVPQVSMDVGGAKGSNITLDPELMSGWVDPDKPGLDKQFTIAKSSNSSTSTATVATSDAYARDFEASDDDE